MSIYVLLSSIFGYLCSSFLSEILVVYIPERSLFREKINVFFSNITWKGSSQARGGRGWDFVSCLRRLWLPTAITQQFCSAFARRIEAPCRIDWTALPMIRSVTYKWSSVISWEYSEDVAAPLFDWWMLHALTGLLLGSQCSSDNSAYVFVVLPLSHSVELILMIRS